MKRLLQIICITTFLGSVAWAQQTSAWVTRQYTIVNSGLEFFFRVPARFPTPEYIEKGRFNCKEGLLINSRVFDEWRIQTKAVLGDDFVQIGTTRFGCDVNSKLFIQSNTLDNLVKVFRGWFLKLPGSIICFDTFEANCLTDQAGKISAARYISGSRSNFDKSHVIAIQQDGKTFPLVFDNRITPVQINRRLPYTVAIPRLTEWWNYYIVDEPNAKIVMWQSQEAPR